MNVSSPHFALPLDAINRLLHIKKVVFRVDEVVNESDWRLEY